MLIMTHTRCSRSYLNTICLHPLVPSFALCQAHQIDLYHLGNPHHYQRQRSQGDSSGGAGTVVSSSSSVGVTSSAWEPITEELVLQALHLLVQPSTYPAIVMCNQGRHRTGTVIGTFRKLQRWALSSILEEYRRYAGSKIRLMNEQVCTQSVLCWWAIVTLT